MKRRKKIVTITVIVLISLIFVLPTTLFGILNWGILPPEKLTPLVIEQTNKFLEAHLECERIELTYFETYPYIGVKLTNGRLISHMAEDSIAHQEELAIPSDSLLSFSKATVSFQPLDYLFGGKITIKEFSIEKPRFYGFMNKDGRANWDIYHSVEDSAGTSDKAPLPPIDLQKVRIRDGRFTYEDHKAELFTEIHGFFLNIDGSLTAGKNMLDVETGSSSILFRSPTYTLKNDLSLKLKSHILLADHYHSITLRDAELLVNNLPFTADGSILQDPETLRSRIDMEIGLKISDMNDLLKFIPDAYFQNRDKTLAAGSIIMEGKINGFMGDSIVPDVNLCCKIENGSYHVKGIKQGIDTLQMDLDIHLNGLYPDSSFLSLEQFTIKGLNTSVDVQGKITNLMENPAINTSITGKIDFTRLAKEFLNPDTLLLEGVMEANLKAVFTVNDLMQSQFGKVHAAGKLNIDNLKALSEPLGLNLLVGGMHFSIDTTMQENKYIGKKGLLKAVMTVDTINIQYKEEINTNVSNLHLTAQTSPVIDTAAVIPMTGTLQFDRLLTRMPDSVWLVAGHTVLKGGIKSSASDKQIPTAGATISIDTLKYISIPYHTGVILSGSTFNIEALPYRDARRQQVQARRDTSTLSEEQRKQRAERARQLAANRTAPDSSDITGQLLRRWEARGNVSFNKLRIVSHLFPIPISMDPTTLKFNTNNITLTDARLHLGKSDLTLSGELSQIRQAMLRGGMLKGSFQLTSDYIDCTQLMQAINSGILYSETHSQTLEQTPMNADSIATLDAQNLQTSLAGQSVADTTDQLLVIPKFLDLTLQTNAKRIDFKELEMEDVTGEIVVREQSLNLNKLNMNSNIGKGNLTMVYTAKNQDSATAGFDLDMEGIKVEKMIGLLPAIDTLVPMLRSFEGILDCQMTATCQLDSSMSLVLPSLNSACYLHGNNMVLLDGETFTEISKTLMFKNKKRNVIDSISVDLAIKDNKIEVFPFLVEMDRYRVAVGGTHNLDMTFNYHISVLKSPVPFKLGIDVTGNLDDFKYKITKCKYKDIFKPAREAELDSTRKDLRKEIRAAIREQMKVAAPELGT